MLRPACPDGALEAESRMVKMNAIAAAAVKPVEHGVQRPLLQARGAKLRLPGPRVAWVAY